MGRFLLYPSYKLWQDIPSTWKVKFFMNRCKKFLKILCLLKLVYKRFLKSKLSWKNTRNFQKAVFSLFFMVLLSLFRVFLLYIIDICIIKINLKYQPETLASQSKRNIRLAFFLSSSSFKRIFVGAVTIIK